MPDPSRHLLPAVRRWIPSAGLALLLSGLAGLAVLLRFSVVTSKALERARERFLAAREHPLLSSFKWEDAAVLGTHFSTLLLGGMAVVALITMRWWCPPAPPEAGPPAAREKTNPRYRIALLAIVLLAAGLRLPLASGSLWWDELWNMKFATVGEWRQDPADPDHPTFQPTSWSRAAWYFNKPANHPVFTLPSKFCHTVWQKVTGAAPGSFSEIVLRLPVLAGGLAALLLTAALATRLAGERAGLLAATLIALHPWLIRYGADARSYGLTLFFTAAALYSLERATAGKATRRQLWWWLFGACQFLLMWAHVVAHVSICGALFASAVWLIGSGPPGNRGRQFAQLLIINSLAAALLLTAYLPNLLQAMTWGERNDDGNLLTGAYFLRTLSQAAAGMEPPLYGNRAGIPVMPWWGLALILTAGLAAATTGFRSLIRLQPRATVIPGVLTGFILLFLAGVKLADFYFYHRFIIAIGIPIILLVAIGLSRLPRTSVIVGVLAIYAVLTFPQTRLLLTRSYAPFREVVAALHAAAARLGPAPPIAVGYGLGSHVMQCYEPALRDIRDDPAEKLRASIDQARRGNRPLFVALGYEALNRLNLPDGFALLDDPALFERIGTWHGIEPEFTFHLLQLKPLPSN